MRTHTNSRPARGTRAAALIAPLVLGAALLAPTGAHAQDFLGGRLSIHGYATYGFGSTNGNEYLLGRAAGESQYLDLALNGTAQLGERFRLNAQGDWQRQEAGRAALDHAFGEYRVADALIVRAGQVKQPFGISTETYRVGTTRPFLFLPQSVYGSVGFTGLAYRGAGLTGSHYASSGWGMSYDVYGGSLQLKEIKTAYGFLDGAPPESDANDDDLEGETERMRRLVGGRITLSPPSTGLTVGVSSWTSTFEHEEDGQEERRTSTGVHLAYAGSQLTLRAEAARELEGDSERKLGGYIEGAYKLIGGLELAAQRSAYFVELPQNPSSDRSPLLQHFETALGLNYWLRPGIVFRAATHRVTGNRLALPDRDKATTQGVREDTRVLTFGTQVSF